MANHAMENFMDYARDQGFDVGGATVYGTQAKRLDMPIECCVTLMEFLDEYGTRLWQDRTSMAETDSAKGQDTGDCLVPLVEGWAQKNGFGMKPFLQSLQGTKDRFSFKKEQDPTFGAMYGVYDAEGACISRVPAGSGLAPLAELTSSLVERLAYNDGSAPSAAKALYGKIVGYAESTMNNDGKKLSREQFAQACVDSALSIYKDGDWRPDDDFLRGVLEGFGVDKAKLDDIFHVDNTEPSDVDEEKNDSLER